MTMPNTTSLDPGSYDLGAVTVTSFPLPGFDPLVVPTLIDRQKRKVVVDSKVVWKGTAQNAPTSSELFRRMG